LAIGCLVPALRAVGGLSARLPGAGSRLNVADFAGCVLIADDSP
jgi:hypothetical protein